MPVCPMRTAVRPQLIKLEDTSWLFIIDNEENGHILRPFWTEKTSIIFTSQTYSYSLGPYARCFEATSFSDDLGSAFLLQLTDDDVQAQDEHAGNTTAISKAVGGSPLALAHIAGFKEVSRCSFQDLLDLVNTSPAYSFDMSNVETSYPHTVDSAFILALMQVDEQTHKLLRFMSVLHADSMETRLLKSAILWLSGDGYEVSK